MRFPKFTIVTLFAMSIMNQTVKAENISLNGSWRFHIPDSVANVGGEFKHPRMVTVPHTYNIMPGLEDYAGPAVYERELPITPSMKGKTIRLKFGAVYHDAIVMVNGRKVGEHLNAGYTPFSFDITPYINWASGATNTLRVETNNRYTDSNLPYRRSFDWQNDGGIYRDVHLHISGPLTIRYTHITPQLNAVDSSATASFKIRLWQPIKRRLTFSVTAKELPSNRIIYNSGKKTLKPVAEGVYVTEASFDKIKPWHFDSPNLYSIETVVYDGEVPSDTLCDRFGFRTFYINNRSFNLNGETIRLPGVESMPGSNPAFGAAESHEYMAKTVELMKSLNVTITRHHWPQDDYRISLMDSLGILVMEELSWWGGPAGSLTPELRESAERQLSEMIEAHYNHPSIFAWGLSNEVGNNRDELLSLREFTKALDTTRLIVAISNGIHRRLADDPSCALDLPTFNDYVGSWHSEQAILPEVLRKIDAAIPTRPLLITEAGLCEPVHAGGDARRINDMLYHVNEWRKCSFISGYIYFCLEDYRTQMGEEGLGVNKIRRHGLTDKCLNPKASFYVFRQLASPIEIVKVKPAGEQARENTLTNLYSLDRKSRSVEITLRNTNTIPSYSLRDYYIEYLDNSGKICRVDIPTMAPGDTFTATLPSINSEYHFSVKRPMGFSVIDY